MIALVEGAIRQRTPNEIALTLVLSAFTLVFLIVVIPLWPMAWNAEQYMMGYLGLKEPLHSLGTDVPTLIALLVCLIPTTIGALLAAIGIAGMDRALQANIIAKSGKSVELAGDIDVVHAGQDRHDHRGQPPRHQVHSRRRIFGCRSGAAGRPGLRGGPDARRQEHRRVIRRGNQNPNPGAAGGEVCAVHRPDPHERRRSSRRQAHPQRSPGRH